jgi:hypothetical protein
MFKIIKSKPFIIATIIVLIGASICYLTVYSKYAKTWRIAKQLQEQQKVAENDKEILTQLKKIILLPDNVTPTMAIITSAETLKKQQPIFFNDAKDGDHLIIYPDMAIIYDAGLNKIMKVGPVQTAAPVTSVSSSTQPIKN